MGLGVRLPVVPRVMGSMVSHVGWVSTQWDGGRMVDGSRGDTVQRGPMTGEPAFPIHPPTRAITVGYGVCPW